MARRKKKSDKKTIISKTVIILILAVFLGTFAVKSFVRFLHTSELFTVTAVEPVPSLQFIDSSDLSGLRGKNIFKINIRNVQRNLQARYPQIDNLRVRRKFPNTILIAARKREPFAVVVSDGRQMVVDEDGYVLSFDPNSKGDLPSIRGVEQISQVSIGSPIRDRHLQAALEIVGAFRNNQRLERFKVEYADVKNLSKITMGLSNQMDIILDREKIPVKMDKLALVLSQNNLDFKKINYIDLRFKEPVIGQK